MMGIILKILSIIGILLLILVGTLLTVLLLVLFVPLTYKACGSMDGGGRELKARVRWLFGLLRADYRYPEPGRFTVKLLWKTLYDSGQGSAEGGNEGRGRRGKKDGGKKDSGKKDKGRGDGQADGKQDGAGAAGSPGQVRNGAGAAGLPGQVRDGAGAGSPGRVQGSAGSSGMPEATGTGAADSGASESGTAPSRNAGSGAGGSEGTAVHEGTEALNSGTDEADASVGQELQDKFEKIRYTIRDKYDKIKKIWENISYYTELLREDNTRALWGHVKMRLRKILRSVRPQHVEADILFGAASPDATGYAFGVYGMLSPYLGTKVCLTPDFTQAILKGRFALSGHVTVAVILWNALKVALDRRLRLFMKRMKAGRKKDG